MKILQMQPYYMVTPTHFMYSVSAKLRPKLFSTSSRLRALCTTSLNLSNPCKLIPASSSTAKKTVSKERLRARVKISDAQLKENWLASLSCPIPADESGREGDLPHINTGPEWILGIDPDLSGALAVLKTDDLGCSAQVFDSPHLQVPVGKRTRRRLDVKSIVKLLQSFNAPIGTLAYLEQSIPFPQDGKQVCGSGLKTLLEPFSISVLNICFVILLVARSISFCSMKGWWSGGFGYGLWIGMLVASGFTVVPVPSFVWKNEFELYGNHSSKDDSRRVASNLFPSMSSLLKRKKDHGRAEALLIAAYGKDMKMKLDASRISDEMIA